MPCPYSRLDQWHYLEMRSLFRVGITIPRKGLTGGRLGWGWKKDKGGNNRCGSLKGPADQGFYLVYL